jgi:hypothetical protein
VVVAVGLVVTDFVLVRVVVAVVGLVVVMQTFLRLALVIKVSTVAQAQVTIMKVQAAAVVEVQ